MECKCNPRPTPQLVLGIIIIVVGVLITLDNLDILSAGQILRWWPLALMALGLVQLFEADTPGRRMCGAILLGIGSLNLLARLHVLHFLFPQLWPLILVALGLFVLYHAVTRERGDSGETATLTAVAVLSGVERTCTSQDFRGGEITAILGGCEVDLRQAEIRADEASIHVLALFGGIEIKVPEDWVVVSEGFPILGGFEERTRSPKEGAKKRLLIKGAAIMGGVEIKN